MPSGALEGLVVVDFSHYLAGPYCTRLLAALGAEVIKIEKPGTGDGARRLGPFPNDVPHPERSGVFLYLNANKKSITLDLKTAVGVKIAKELIASADIVVENFRPGVMDRLGLGYETLRAINPRVVMASISNFGQTGPYRDLQATEIVEYALAGLLYITGEPTREPLKAGGSLAQYIAGQTAMIGIMMALFDADQSGQGQQVDVSIMEAASDHIESSLAAIGYGGAPSKRAGLRHQSHPWHPYPCRDGWAAIIAGPPRNWPRIAELTGEPRLADPKYATPFQRQQPQARDEIDALLLPWLLEHDKQEIYHQGQAMGFAFGYVATTEDLFKSPQLRARDFFVEIDHPATGPLMYPGAPYQMSESTWRWDHAPLLGEHNEEVLCGRLGYTREDLTRLRQAGTV
ncbi:MAG: CoA transferase [Chloroflexi bacterium]|nr:CoA transferase [Chloroflexota bacterium]